MDWISQKLIAVPYQLIELPQDVVILRRGGTQLKLVGEGVSEALQLILGDTESGGKTGEEILDLFDSQARENVVNLIQELLARKILAPKGVNQSLEKSSDTNTEIFFWHCGTSIKDVQQQLSQIRILALGINCISRQLTMALIDSGTKAFRLLDHPLLRNKSLFDDTNQLKNTAWPASLNSPEIWSGYPDPSTFDCLIASSDFGGQDTILECNKYCLENRRLFLPLILHEYVGYVGPLVVPGETACFECLRARQNSHLIEPVLYRTLERSSSEGQFAIGFHPCMSSIIGNIAAFEVIKFFGGIPSPLLIGSFIEVHLLTGQMNIRKILKVPRCIACSTLRKVPEIGVRRVQPEEKSRVMT